MTADLEALGGDLVKVTMIEYPEYDDWVAVKQRALVTVGLNPQSAPGYKWKKSMLDARHSPIRRLRFSFLIENIPYWVSVHLCRHVHAQPYIKTHRNDRQSDYDRREARQDAPVSMIWDMNAEELMVIANKRLCANASPETRSVVREMCNQVIAFCPEFECALVPMCEYHGGVCHEMHPCGKCG